MKIKGQGAPGHDDLDLCDLRNSLVLRIKSCAYGQEAGLTIALGMVNEKIKYNALKREREEWDKKGGAPEYV